MQTVIVQIRGRTRTLSIEERVYPDRTCGQYESGWNCYDEARGKEYFISDTGQVWAQPANVVVGIAPEVKAQADRLEALLDSAPDEC